MLDIRTPGGAEEDWPASHVIAMHREQIVEGDLHLDGRHMAMKALKVTGDLVVDGNATFAGTVVVENGAPAVAGARVVGVARSGRDRLVDAGRGDQPFTVHVRPTRGDDYRLATYTQTEAYFKKLAAERLLPHQ